MNPSILETSENIVKSAKHYFTHGRSPYDPIRENPTMLVSFSRNAYFA
jgi:hypothetical protein